jgi:hypothetical protein
MTYSVLFAVLFAHIPVTSGVCKYYFVPFLQSSLYRKKRGPKPQADEVQGSF